MYAKQNPPRGRGWANPQTSNLVGQDKNCSSISNCIKLKVGEKIVGEIWGDEFQKYVHSSRHFLRVPPAIAFDVSVLSKAIKLGVERIKVVDLDTNQVFRTTMSLVKEKGFEIDRGYGRQIALVMNYWQVEKRQFRSEGLKNG